MHLTPAEVLALYRIADKYVRRQRLSGELITTTEAAVYARLQREATAAADDHPAADVDLIGTAEAARILGYSVRTMRRRAREFGGAQIQGLPHWYFSRAELCEIVTRRAELALLNGRTRPSLSADGQINRLT